LTVDGDVLTASPGTRLTDTDRAAIRVWKRHLLALVEVMADTRERIQ
jgi:hypothetical protein